MTKRKSRRKYQQGERITSLDVMTDQEHLMVHGKVYHRGWVRAWPINLALNYLQYGCYKVVPIKKESEVQT